MAARALAAFHLRAGARAALRASAIGVSVVVFALGSAPEAAYTFRTIVLGVVGPARPGVATARLFLAAGALALAMAAARRLTLGASGWMRSLPASAKDARRAAWIACLAATAPAMLLPAVGLLLAPLAYRAPLSAVRVLALAPLFAAAAALALRVEPRAARALALGALLAAAFAGWGGLALSLALLALWDRAAGGVRPRAIAMRRRTTTRAVHRARSPRRAAHGLLFRFAWRATGWPALADALLYAALPAGFCALVLANNADLEPGTRATLARLGAGLAAAFVAASLVGPLLARRPPWPWLRTLPWSARERVLADAAALWLAAGAASLGAAGGYAVAERGMHASSLLARLGCALGVALVAAAAGAAALRAGAHRQTGAVGETALVGVLAAVGVALVPSLALLAPAAALAFVALGARRDRGGRDAVRWSELRHGAEGDPGWIARA